jgi:hypothetical protein
LWSKLLIDFAIKSLGEHSLVLSTVAARAETKSSSDPRTAPTDAICR